jgi:hypothetical protein
VGNHGAHDAERAADLALRFALQDVTLRLIAQRGVFRSKACTSTTQTLRRLFVSRGASLTAHVGSRRHASARVGASSELLYLENETAFEKVLLPPPLIGRKYHLFCSAYNAGALALAKELSESNIFVTEGKKASAALYFTTDVDELAQCDHSSNAAQPTLCRPLCTV